MWNSQLRLCIILERDFSARPRLYYHRSKVNNSWNEFGWMNELFVLSLVDQMNRVKSHMLFSFTMGSASMLIYNTLKVWRMYVNSAQIRQFTMSRKYAGCIVLIQSMVIQAIHQAYGDIVRFEVDLLLYRPLIKVIGMVMSVYLGLLSWVMHHYLAVNDKSKSFESVSLDSNNLKWTELFNRLENWASGPIHN